MFGPGYNPNYGQQNYGQQNYGQSGQGYNSQSAPRQFTDPFGRNCFGDRRGDRKKK